MRILISAYYCRPARGSEDEIGWGYVRHIAQLHDVWVLTHGRNRDSIESYKGADLSRARFVYVTVPGGEGASVARLRTEVHYYLWQIRAFYAGRALQKNMRFDLVHHITMGRYWSPSLLAMLPAPFIWGPVGGGESTPRILGSSFGVSGKIHELTRRVARFMGELDPLVRLTARNASAVFATTEETATRVRQLGCERIYVTPSVGLEASDLAYLFSIPQRSIAPFRLFSIGRLLHWKGFHLAVRAFADFHRYFGQSEYWLIGTGPEHSRLQELASELGVGDCVKFCGAMSRFDAFAALAEADVLLHPSLHESGGFVCIEAMAAGRPVICLNLGGPALQVTGETGIRVEATSIDQTIRCLTQSIAFLAQEPTRRLRMGELARRRVAEHFSWTHKSTFISGVYSDTLQRALRGRDKC